MLGLAINAQGELALVDDRAGYGNDLAADGRLLHVLAQIPEPAFVAKDQLQTRRVMSGPQV